MPAGWLTFAESAVYKSYDIPTRLFDISVVNDQQLAGVVMKLVGGFFLWGVMAVVFIRFATMAGEDDRAAGKPALDRRAPAGRGEDGEVLTWEQVQRELAVAGPAPAEPSVDGPG